MITYPDNGNVLDVVLIARRLTVCIFLGHVASAGAVKDEL